MQIAIPFRVINVDVVKANHNNFRHGMAHVGMMFAAFGCDGHGAWIKAVNKSFV